MEKPPITLNYMSEETRTRIIEYACSAWAMGSSRDVEKSFDSDSDEAWFVKVYATEIDWVAENLVELALGGIKCM